MNKGKDQTIVGKQKETKLLNNRMFTLEISKEPGRDRLLINKKM